MKNVIYTLCIISSDTAVSCGRGWGKAVMEHSLAHRMVAESVLHRVGEVVVQGVVPGVGKAIVQCTREATVQEVRQQH